MKIQVIFENSGDTITFDAINSEVVEYYIENLNNLNSNKFLATHPDKLEKSLKKLKDSIHSVNEFAVDLIGIEFPNLTDEQYLDQRVLNDLHCQWVKSQSILFDVKQLRNSNNIKTAEYAEAIFHQSDDDGMLPSFDLVLKKLNLSDPYSQINLLLHAVEEIISKSCKFSTESWIEFPNKFDKNNVTNNISNLVLPFNHLGRTLYNKYLNFDSNLEYEDENTFDELLGFVNINLCRAQTVSYSIEYTEWCNRNGKMPSGDQLNIGYLPDLEDKLYDYRLLLHRNIVQQNAFSLHIV